MTADPTAVVERYLGCLVAHDWEGLADCLAADVVRIGPFGDTYSGPAYLDFISALMPTLRGYAMTVDRVTTDGPVAVAQLSETMEIDGAAVETKEALVFEVGPEGRIRRIEIYIQRRR